MRDDYAQAGVAELADALDSKSGTRKSVWVRAPPPVESKAATLLYRAGARMKTARKRGSMLRSSE